MDMILLNVSSRQVTDAELVKSYEVLDSILKAKKNSGSKFGRIRAKLAEMLGVSTGQVSKIENVVHNAVPPVLKAVQDGELSINTANEIAQMDAVSQLATVQNGLENVKPKEIKEKKQRTERPASAKRAINRTVDAISKPYAIEADCLCICVSKYLLYFSLLFFGVFPVPEIPS